MAKSLRENMPDACTLLISDVNKQVLDRFISETSQSRAQDEGIVLPHKVEIALDVRQLAERSVISFAITPHFAFTNTAFLDRHHHLSTLTKDCQRCLRLHQDEG